MHPAPPNPASESNPAVDVHDGLAAVARDRSESNPDDTDTRAWLAARVDELAVLAAKSRLTATERARTAWLAEATDVMVADGRRLLRWTDIHVRPHPLVMPGAVRGGAGRPCAAPLP